MSRTVLRDALESALNAAFVEVLGSERRLRYRDRGSTHLTTTQFLALSRLEFEEAVTAGQLAKNADLNPGTVSGMLDDLEAKGLVKHQTDPRDRRVVTISLTPNGRAVVAEMHVLWRARPRSTSGVFQMTSS